MAGSGSGFTALDPTCGPLLLAARERPPGKIRLAGLPV